MLRFPLDEYEMEQLSIIEGKINKDQRVLQLTDDENTKCFDMIQMLKQRAIVKDFDINNTNAYLIIGSFDEFKRWIEHNNRTQISPPRSSVMKSSLEPLSEGCEELLLEIIEHRDRNGACDLGYWERRFDGLMVSEDVLLRSQFGILKKREMISVSWADDVPNTLFVLENGFSYFEVRQENAYQESEQLKKRGEKVKYDVFISHANQDKIKYVNRLVNEIKILGVDVFYDKDSIYWGDNWKKVILDGTEKSRFAIIVISDHFFGRDWTERELKEFLKRQNESGQKIVLPLLYNVTIDRFNEEYPALSEIQVLETTKYSCREIALLFARELIKKLKDE